MDNNYYESCKDENFQYQFVCWSQSSRLLPFISHRGEQGRMLWCRYWFMQISRLPIIVDDADRRMKKKIRPTPLINNGKGENANDWWWRRRVAPIRTYSIKEHWCRVFHAAYNGGNKPYDQQTNNCCVFSYQHGKSSRNWLLMPVPRLSITFSIVWLAPWM